MKVTAYRGLLCVLSVLAVGTPVFAQTPTRPAASPQPGQTGQPASRGAANGAAPKPGQPAEHPGWWHRDDVRKELSLTSDQVVRFDHIWDETLPGLREENNQLDEREAQLSRLIEMNADDDRIAHQIDRVETARSLLNKDRELMLVHMRQVLTPDQRVKFSQRWARIREQQQQQPQRQGGPGSQNRPSPPPGGAQ